MEINKIYNMDCLDGIKKIEDKSIKLICTDPPYALGLSHNGQRGTFNDLNIAKPFFKGLVEEFKRVLTDDGCLHMFMDWHTSPFYCPIVKGIIGVDNMLVWDKMSGPGNFYTNQYESILFHTNNRQFRGKGLQNIIRGIPGFAAGAKKEDGEKVHPTQKPTALIRKLIQDTTVINDTVLDCFMGSGTTAIAALQTQRNFIGFEIDEKYYEIANERIERFMLAYTE